MKTTARIRCGCGAEFEATKVMSAIVSAEEWVERMNREHNCTLPKYRASSAAPALPSPCKDCGRPSIDGFWCETCHEGGKEAIKDMERDSLEALASRAWACTIWRCKDCQHAQPWHHSGRCWGTDCSCTTAHDGTKPEPATVVDSVPPDTRTWCNCGHSLDLHEPGQCHIWGCAALGRCGISRVQR